VPSIDERIVSMAFENQVFEQRVAQTMGTLSKLDTALKNVGSTNGLDKIEASANKVTLNAPMSALDKLRSKFGQGVNAQSISDIERAGNKVTLEQPAKAIDKTQAKLDQLNAGGTFTDIENAASRVSLSGIANAVDNISSKFTMLQGAATVALGNIASQAVMKGASFAKSFAFGPIQQGMGEYQTNLGSIQTILANTQGQQVTGLGNVNKYLGELNTYSDQTIYNFSEMARNIGTFTAAGVDLPKSTAAIKGIANLAALSGSNSQQASTAMYQLSQAIAAGRVGLQDWNSVVNAGMGGAVFQKSLMRTAENMGALKDGAVQVDKATGKATVNGKSFRESIMAKPGEQSWLTSDVLTRTLSQMTGDMTDAQLAAQGFSAEQIKAIQDQAKMAKQAATQVKTLPQVFDVARETIGSGWSKTFQLIFGDFGESKKTFTDLSNFINGFINTMSNARNKILGDWKALGGRTALISGIKAAFEALTAVVTPIRDAFRDIFPATTGRQLFELTAQFANLMRNLKPSEATIDNLRRIFAGLFAVVHIGWSVIKGFVGVILNLLGAAGKGAGGFLSFVAGIGDFLTGVDRALTQGGALTGFFRGLSSVLQAPVRLVTSLSGAIAGLFKPREIERISAVTGEVIKFKDGTSQADQFVNNLKTAWVGLVKWFDKAKTALEPWFSAFVDKLSSIGQVIGNAFSNLNFDTVLGAVQTGLIGGIFLMLKKTFSGGGVLESITGTLDAVKGVLGGVSGQLETMQKNVQAKTLLAIGAALLALAGGIFILSTIDGDKLAKAMTAAAVGLGELMGAMKMMMSGLGKTATLQLPLIAAGMIGMAAAVTILAAAMKIFATMSWEDIAKGLAGLAGSLVAVGLGVKLLGPSLLIQGPALIMVAAGLNLIALAVSQFADMSWVEMGRGLLGVSMSLLAIGAATQLMGPNLILIGPGLIAVALGMNILAGAIAVIGRMDPAALVQGITGMAGALLALGVAIVAIPPTAALQGAGLVVIAAGLASLAGALGVIGNLPIPVLIQGLLGMGAALGILAVGLTLMTGTLGGSAALLAAGAAFLMLAPALAILGNLSWGTLLKGLAAMALTLGTLAVVGALAAGPIALLGGALVALGAGMAAISGAVYILAKGFALLGDSGAKGVTVMVTALTAFVAILPKIIIDFVKGLVDIIKTIAQIAPQVVTAVNTILNQLLTIVIQSAPKMAVAIGVLVLSILTVLTENVPKILTAGFQLLGAFLTGIQSNIGSIISTVANIVVKFLDGLRAQTPRIVSSGAKLLASFISGISSKISLLVGKVGELIVKFIGALAAQYPKIIAQGAILIVKFVGAIASNIGKVISAGVNFITKFLGGIASAIPKIVNKGLDVAEAFLKAVSRGAVRLVNMGFDAVINFLNGTAKAIRERGPELRQAGWNVVDAIIHGILDGFGELWGKITDKAAELASHLPKVFRKVLSIGSPSAVFAEIGRFTMQGMTEGMNGEQGALIRSAQGVGTGVINAFKDLFQIRSPSQVLKDIGKEVGHGFRDGLDGSADDIRSSFASLRDKITGEIQTTRDNIKSESDNLKSLLSEDDPDLKAISASQNTLVGYNRTLIALQNANGMLTRGLKNQKGELIGLSRDLDGVTAKLDKAKQVLADAIQTRDSAFESFKQKYSEVPDIGGLVDQAVSDAAMTPEERATKIAEDQTAQQKKSSVDQVALYKKALADKITAAKNYQATLEKLRALGLDDVTYKKLLDEGPTDQAFADQLLATGKAGVTELNKLDAQMVTTATSIAKESSTNLYQAGVDAAQGLVNGLKSPSRFDSYSNGKYRSRDGSCYQAGTEDQISVSGYESSWPKRRRRGSSRASTIGPRSRCGSETSWLCRYGWYVERFGKYG
jgi:tape measure domain-containing protein